jgi:hypothetical protein
MTDPALEVLFLSRYDVLRGHYLAGIWANVPAELMRVRPHERMNSIAWNLWHIARVEDAGVNGFVDDARQVFDSGGWSTKLGLPWRHHGSGMDFAEVDALNRDIDLEALRGYGASVEAGTREVVGRLEVADLAQPVPEAVLRRVVVDEGLAHSEPESLVANYAGWSRGRCLVHFALTHSYQHLGEIAAIGSLLDLELA